MPPFQGFSSRKLLFLLIPYYPASKSSRRRRYKLDSLTNISIAIRPYKNCSRLNKPYRVTEDAEKYIKCIRTARPCDLASLDTARWKRLEEQRKKLKEEFRKVIAKQ